jgi:hypothetical protein
MSIVDENDIEILLSFHGQTMVLDETIVTIENR